MLSIESSLMTELLFTVTSIAFFVLLTHATHELGKTY